MLFLRRRLARADFRLRRLISSRAEHNRNCDGLARLRPRPREKHNVIQSSVPEHAELQLLLSMVTPLSLLERVPTYKEAMDNVKDKDLHTYGFLGYPVLQTADIVMYGDTSTDLIVPVGED